MSQSEPKKNSFAYAFRMLMRTSLFIAALEEAIKVKDKELKRAICLLEITQRKR